MAKYKICFFLCTENRGKALGVVELCKICFAVAKFTEFGIELQHIKCYDLLIKSRVERQWIWIFDLAANLDEKIGQFIDLRKKFGSLSSGEGLGIWLDGLPRKLLAMARGYRKERIGRERIR